MTKELRQKLMNRKGFTLIELIVVIAIIAILAAVLIPRFTGFTSSARKKGAMSDARNIFVALEAADAQGELTTPVDADDAETVIEKYTGKNLINDADADMLDNGDTEISDVTRGTNKGLTFTYTKIDGGKTYTVQVDDSVFPSDADES